MQKYDVGIVLCKPETYQIMIIYPHCIVLDAKASQEPTLVSCHYWLYCFVWKNFYNKTTFPQLEHIFRVICFIPVSQLPGQLSGWFSVNNLNVTPLLINEYKISGTCSPLGPLRWPMAIVQYTPLVCAKFAITFQTTSHTHLCTMYDSLSFFFLPIRAPK